MKPSATAHASVAVVAAQYAANAAVRLSFTRRRERAEHLHHEHELAVLLERRLDLALEQAHDVGVLAEDLRAHAAGRDLHAWIGVDALDERLDGRDVVRVERIQADLDADVHE